MSETPEPKPRRRYWLPDATILGWLALAFVVWWVIEKPAAAAHIVHNIDSFLTSAAHGLSSFFARIG